MQTQEPNLFTLAGQGVQVTYSTSSFTGRPQLNYEDADAVHNFTGDEIRVAQADPGTLVSVSLTRTAGGAGDTSFTLLLPRIQLAQDGLSPVTTLGILARHRLVDDAPPTGQQDSYTTLALDGTARAVDF